MRTRIGSFIFGIISLIVSGFLIFLVFDLNGQTHMEGFERLSLIVTFPIYILFYCLLFGSLATSVICFIKSIFSCIPAIKVLAIILLIISLIAIGLGVYLLKGFIGVL